MTVSSIIHQRWRGIIASVAFGLLFSLTTLVPPLFIRRIIADASDPAAAAAGGVGNQLLMIALILAAVYALRGVCRYLYGLTSHQAAYRLLHDLLVGVYTHLQRLSHRFFDRQRTGNLIARSVGDVEAIEDFVAHGIPELAQAVVIPAAMIVVLLTIDPTLTLIVLAPLPIAALATYFMTRRIRGVWRNVRQRFSSVVAQVEDNLMGMSEIKSFNRERERARQIDAASGTYRDTIIQATSTSLLPSGVIEMTGGVGIILAATLGGNAALRGTLTVADLYVFVAYLAFIYQPFLKLADIGEVLHRAVASYSRIAELLRIEPDIVSPPDALLPAQVTASVGFDNVTFSYRPGVIALREVSFAIEPGEVVSLVGQTGAGKTTVTRLVPRFYDPQEGRVLVGGHDVRTLDLDFLRSRVAIVSQDVFLFHGSIRDNILFGRPDASDQEVVTAAQAANAEEFIRDLPDGYDTVVGDRGVRLSGGQRQRVSIARAVLKDAPILVLDEATSSVDTETEQLIQQALERLMQGRTALVIAHRVSTIERADRLIVLDHGQVAESGVAGELIAANGRYRSLVDAQIQPA